MKTTCLILIAAAVAFSGCSNEPPTDASLIKSFDANQAIFIRLHDMIQADRSVLRVGDDVVGDIWFNTTGSSLDDALDAAGLSRERYNDYMKLLHQVGAYRVSVAFYEESSSAIGMYSAGNVAESHSVDIVFVTQSPEPIVNDTVNATIHDNTSAYLELAESWYIHREHD